MANKVSSTVRGGQLTEINISVDGPNEVKIYRDLMKMDMPKCPYCGKDLYPNPEDCGFTVSNPLVSTFGMELGVPKTKCQICGKVIIDDTTLDLGAFPSIVNYLKGLRAEYQRRVKTAQQKNRGKIQ